MNQRVRAVIRKEFREYRRNRMIIITMAALPVMFLAIPLVQALLLPDNVPDRLLQSAAGQALLLFLLVPLMIPTTVAAYSVIGEREQGTIEPVLTTPVDERELLAGKAVAAAVPATLIAWLLFGVFLSCVQLFAHHRMVEAVWHVRPLAALALVPALAGFATVLGLGISVRSRDIRVAQQLAALATIPALFGISVVAFGVVEPTSSLLLVGALLFAVIDVGGWRLVAATFDRERLLTRFGGGV